METVTIKWSSSVTFEQVEKVAPVGYRRARYGEDRKPGLYGEGFAGEPLVVLLPDDSGEWFDSLAGKDNVTTSSRTA